MLTHGWSRFSWNGIENGVRINSKDNDSSLSISGKITTLKNTPAVHYSVTLISTSDNAFIGTGVTNEQGEFHFTGIDYTDTTSFLIQATNPKGRLEDVNILIDPAHFPLTHVDNSVVSRYLISEQGISEQAFGVNFYKRFMYNSLEDIEKAKILKEIIVHRKKLNYDESKRVSLTSYVITPDIIERYGNGNVNIADLLQMVPGFTGSNGQISFFGINGYSSYSPLFIVDGVEIPFGEIPDLDLSTISFIEVLRGGEAAIYGVRGGAGVIAVHTKTGAQINMEHFKQKGIKAFEAEGYQVEKNFYSPKYETDESRDSKTTDERTTIYWNGNVNTNSKTATTLSFYTADMSTTYTLTIEGIAENGDLIHESIPIKRTKK